ncbi:MAG: ribosome maturation factor RimM [Aerococcaceae bacterium]|nr:ribosome maturation factor RimM [Aerococcaceae bacterium]
MNYYRIGRIVNTFGIKGQVKVIADTDFAEKRFQTGNELLIIKDDQVIKRVTVEKAQLHKGTYVVSFTGYHNINQVELYKDHWLAIESTQQETLPEDEFYHHQIIGLNVVTTEGQLLGKIKEILTLGSNDVWVVQRHEPKKKDALIPYIEQVVKHVDLQKGEVRIELMDGLIDED